ncbi:hypothetical protein AFE_1228 [Acidithiobacillus ferrooxidans ATCC 23270]|uniref:Uncharacterized protein n=1 Tax=Acidithiobacillus ferrooxidans (strain ATCC 23270 / DSM 14882 / CIP 104768 / NCIMB 8455) TaxID=243159 RepID=B7J8R0_ACIF2|nr:hypothetical protein AFE_1228 [Acidithiobacillus ferrooxidans ATCC 23270]
MTTFGGYKAAAFCSQWPRSSSMMVFEVPGRCQSVAQPESSIATRNSVLSRFAGILNATKPVNGRAGPLCVHQMKCQHGPSRIRRRVVILTARMQHIEQALSDAVCQNMQRLKDQVCVRFFAARIQTNIFSIGFPKRVNKPSAFAFC